MNNIYDNGALMIGNIDMVIDRVKKEIKEEEISRQEVSAEKKELFDYDWLNEGE